MVTPEQAQIAWDRIAIGYDEYITAKNMELANVALDRVDLQAGMRLLDVAAGSGALSIPAARRGADVVATDFAPTMVERLKTRAHEEALDNLEARVMDGHALDLDDESFDVAASQFGVMLFPDLPRGLSEMARVTKPDGRVLMVTFGPPPNIEFIRFFMAGAQAAVPDFSGMPMDPPPLPFQVADPEVLAHRMAEAGLRDVHVETTNYEMELESGEQLWGLVMTSNPLGAMLVADLTEEQRAAVQQNLETTIRERAGNSDSAILNNQVNIGIGTR